MDAVNNSINITDDHDNHHTDSVGSQYWEDILISIISLSIALTGLIGNSAIILAVAFSRKLHTPQNAFVTSLAVADLIFCFFLNWWVLWYIKGTQIPEFAWLCALVGYMMYSCVGVTLFTLTAIAVNRFIYITKNDLYKKIFTSRKLYMMVATPWILSFGATFTVELINVHKGTFDLKVYQKQKECTNIDTIENFNKLLLPVFLTGFIIPSFTIFVCYIRIYLYLRHHFRTLQQHISLPTKSNSATVESPTPPGNSLSKRQIKITKNLFIVVCAFFIAYTPFFLSIILVPLLHRGSLIGLLGYLEFVGVFANSATNFFIYAWKHPDFKIILRHLMRCSYAKIQEPSRLLRYLLSKHQEGHTL